MERNKIIAYIIANNTLGSSNERLEKATSGSIGYDLKWNGIVESVSSGVAILHTGLYLAPIGGKPDIQVRSRSGLASKGIWVVNSPGTIDSDYRDEVCVLLNIPEEIVRNYNSNKTNFLFPTDLTIGSRIAQLIIPEDYELEKIPDFKQKITTTNKAFSLNNVEGIGSIIETEKIIEFNARNVDEMWKTLFGKSTRRGGFGSTGL